MNVGGMSGIRTRRLKSHHRTNWVEFTYDALGHRFSKLASEYTTGYGTAMCRYTSGATAGNGRTTAGNTTILTSRPGSSRKRASYHLLSSKMARHTA